MHTTIGELCGWGAEDEGEHHTLLHASWPHHVQRSPVLAPCGARHSGFGHGSVPRRMSHRRHRGRAPPKVPGQTVSSPGSSGAMKASRVQDGVTSCMSASFACDSDGLTVPSPRAVPCCHSVHVEPARGREETPAGALLQSARGECCLSLSCPSGDQLGTREEIQIPCHLVSGRGRAWAWTRGVAGVGRASGENGRPGMAHT